LVAGDALKFSVTGSVDFGGTPTDPPDGACAACAFYSLSTFIPLTGISNVVAPVNALYGVFIGSGIPAGPAPSDLNFTGDGGLGLDFTSLFPEVQQVFFIGDGLTGNGTGLTQQFIVPAGATRLFFGMLEGSGWSNNQGSFAVTINDPSLSSSATPEPESLAFVGIGLLGMGVYLKSRKRR
jgi:hypothetical protein